MEQTTGGVMRLADMYVQSQQEIRAQRERNEELERRTHDDGWGRPAAPVADWQQPGYYASRYGCVPGGVAQQGGAGQIGSQVVLQPSIPEGGVALSCKLQAQLPQLQVRIAQLEAQLAQAIGQLQAAAQIVDAPEQV